MSFDPTGCQVGNVSFNFPQADLLSLPSRRVSHWPIQSCLYYQAKWRPVCLSCGKVEMDGVWMKAKELP